MSIAPRHASSAADSVPPVRLGVWSLSAWSLAIRYLMSSLVSSPLFLRLLYYGFFPIGNLQSRCLS